MNISDAIILVAPTVGIACNMETWGLILRMQSNHTERVKGIKDELHSHFHQAIAAYSS